jgi:hypothetical protein
MQCSDVQMAVAGDGQPAAADGDYTLDHINSKSIEFLEQSPEVESCAGSSKTTAAATEAHRQSRPASIGALSEEEPNPDAPAGTTAGGTLALAGETGHAAVALASGTNASLPPEGDPCPRGSPIESAKKLQLLQPAVPGSPPTIAFTRFIASIAAESLGAVAAVGPLEWTPGAVITAPAPAAPAKQAELFRSACEESQDLIPLPSVRMLVKFDGVANKPVKAVCANTYAVAGVTKVVGVLQEWYIQTAQHT